MILWLLAAAFTALVLVILLRPLFYGGAGGGVAPRDVYKAQLAEIDREAAAGLLAEDDAASARTEIARRILRVGDIPDATAAPAPRARLAAIAVVAFLTAAALLIYLSLGRPDLPGRPFAARDLGTESAEQIGPAAQELERQLAAIEDPADRALFLGDAFASLGGLGEAENAYLNALSLRPGDPDILIRLSELDLMRAEGLVTADGLALIDQALTAAPRHRAGNFYRALYDYQQGAYDEAAQRLEALIAGAPEDADWTAQVTALLEEIRTTAAEVEALAGMDDAEREAMVRGMVAQLAARLEDDPSDFDGWLRLAGAYNVLGDHDAARAALSRAAGLAEGEPLLERRVADVEAQLDLD